MHMLMRDIDFTCVATRDHESVYYYVNLSSYYNENFAIIQRQITTPIKRLTKQISLEIKIQSFFFVTL